MTFPTHFDLTPKGEITHRAQLGEDGYTENMEFTLQLNVTSDGSLNIFYYGENEQVIELHEYIEIMELEEH